MATYSTAVGALSPGLLVSDQNTGVFSSLSAPTSNQVLVSTGTNSYSYVPVTNLPSPQSSTGIIQFALYNLGGSPFPSQTITAMGDQTTNYDAAAQVLSCNFTPYSQTSSISIEFYYTAQSMNSAITVNLYAIPSSLPSPFAYGQIYNTQGANLASGCTGVFEVGQIDFTNSLNLALCAFTNTAASGQTGGAVYDYILVKEFANNRNPFLTAQVTSTSATPVTLLSIDVSQGETGVPSSAWIHGSVTFFDSANLISNMQKNWMVLAQYNGTTTTVEIGPVYTLTGVPTLTYTISGSTLTIAVVGEAGQTFICKANYQLTYGGF